MRLLRVLYWVLGINVLFATIVHFSDESDFVGLEPGAPAWRRWLDCYYFGLTTITTVGYGDIQPASFRARMVILGYLLTVLFIGTS
jgi:hypothetical protein